MFTIFEKLGGQAATLEVLHRRRGKRIGSHSLRSWRYYGEIPAINTAHLMAECQERGIPFDVNDFRNPATIQRRSSRDH